MPAIDEIGDVVIQSEKGGIAGAELPQKQALTASKCRTRGFVDIQCHLTSYYIISYNHVHTSMCSRAFCGALFMNSKNKKISF